MGEDTEMGEERGTRGHGREDGIGKEDERREGDGRWREMGEKMEM